MPQNSRKIIITGNQREDVDAQAMARVIIQLARARLADDVISASAGREAAAARASLRQQASSYEEDLA